MQLGTRMFSLRTSGNLQKNRTQHNKNLKNSSCMKNKTSLNIHFFGYIKASLNIITLLNIISNPTKNLIGTNCYSLKSRGVPWPAGHPPDRLCHAKYPMSCNAQWRRLELCMEQVEIFEILGECVVSDSTKKRWGPQKKAELVYKCL